MNIVVCIKQTPVAAETRLDENTKRLVREGVTLTVSSLDRRATLEALRLRKEVGGTVTVLTMGPPQARSALLELLGLGADKGVLLTDAAFAGSDTLATARGLAAALRRLNPDLIMCGKFSIDAETGQVPSEVAELLGLPQVTSIRSIQPTGRPNAMLVDRETDEGFERLEMPLPALVSVVELITTFRRSTPEELQAALAKPLETWSAADLGIDPATVGTKGSPTRVAELRSARLERQGTIVSGDDPQQAARQVADYLVKNGLFSRRDGRVKLRLRRRSPMRPDPRKAIWVVAEIVRGGPRPVTFELLGEAQDLADKLGGEVAAVLVGGSAAKEHIEALQAHGADTVYAALDDRLATYDTLLYTDVLVSAIRRHQPYAVLVPSTTNGRDWAPRVAARLGLGLTGDCVGLELDGNGELAQIKPAFGGNIVSPIYSSTRPIMATVRAGVLEAREPRHDVRPFVIPLELPKGERVAKLLESHVDPALGATKLDGADVVVTVGMGVGGPDKLPVVRELADTMDAAIGITLAVAVAKWLPPQLQVGLTGKSVAPRFYIAVGVSGQPNHLIGNRKARHIIAINNNREAPIFKSANLGVVGDWATIVPALTQALQEAKQRVRD